MFQWRKDQINQMLETNLDTLHKRHAGKNLSSSALEELERLVQLISLCEQQASAGPIYELDANHVGLGVFDVNFYIGGHKDLREAFGDNYIRGVEHWLAHGIAEGRQGCAAFHSAWYLKHHVDVRDAVGENNYLGAIDHWLNQGIDEGRQGCGSFHVTFYLDSQPDLKKALKDNPNRQAIHHWVHHGVQEGRQGVKDFHVAPKS